MKGIILAGGSGTRLYPITIGTSKQLLAVYDKPMIYYPLSTLMTAGIRDILVISTKEDQPNFMKLLKDGSQMGININYIIQPSPDGLAQAFTLGADFIGNDSCAMALGDNIFFGSGFDKQLKEAKENTEKGIATIFGYRVRDPERFGIMEIDKNGKVLSVEEKPKNPKSKYAITGLYFYDNSVVDKAYKVDRSPRNEYEITDLNKIYLDSGKLNAVTLDDEFNWLDTGLADTLLDASIAVKSAQDRTDSIICCPEYIAYQNGWISDEQLLECAENNGKSNYGKFLKKVYDENRGE